MNKLMVAARMSHPVETLSVKQVELPEKVRINTLASQVL
jgi:hypothetical protein